MSAEWSVDDQLLYESRVRTRQGVIAAAAGVLLIVASVIQLSGVHTTVDELTLDLLIANRRFPLDLVAAVINGIASLGMAWTLIYLYRCTRARNTQVRGFIKYIALAAGVLGAVAGVIYGIIVATKVHEFATTGQQTYDQAQHLTSGAGLLVLQLVGQLAALLMAVAFVLVCVQAMRVGLLTKFLGYLGMFAGALVLFQITQVPVVQFVWLVAVGYMISGRWPSGVPDAWRTGRAEAWPSAAEVRARRVAGSEAATSPGRGAATRPNARADARAGARGGAPGGLAGWLAGRARPAATADPASSANGSPEAQATQEPTGANPRTRAGTPKRKRKRRH